MLKGSDQLKWLLVYKREYFGNEFCPEQPHLYAEMRAGCYIEKFQEVNEMKSSEIVGGNKIRLCRILKAYLMQTGPFKITQPISQQFC